MNIRCHASRQTNCKLPQRPLALATLVGLACLALQPAQAQDGLRPYVGASLGRSEGSFGSAQQLTSALPAGSGLGSFDLQRRGTGFKLFAGYPLNDYLALEAGYFDLGKPGFKAVTTPTGQAEGRYKVQGLNLDLVGRLPVNKALSVIGRVGVQEARTQASFSSTLPLALADASQRHANVKYGVGVQYVLASNLVVRAELERYRVNDSTSGNGSSHVNENLWSVGLVFPIGAAAAAPRAMAPAPYAPPPQAAVPMPAPAAAPVVVVQAAPAPMPAPAPAVTQRRRVSFSAESLFGFDRSTVNAEGKAALDKLAGELNGTQFDQVMVQGHTDRLGAEAYNLNLSRQRADAVKTYLVTEGKLDPMKVQAEGKGEATAVTKPEDCVGTQATAKLISCLAPDRRVDVEVVGTR